MKSIDTVIMGRLSKWTIAVAGILMVFTVATSAYGIGSQLLSPVMNKSGGLYNAELVLGESGDQRVPLGVTCSSFSGTETARAVHGSTIEFTFKNVVLKDLTIK